MESKWEVGSWSPGNHCVIEWTKLPEPPFYAAKYRKVAEVYEQADVPKLAAAPEMYELLDCIRKSVALDAGIMASCIARIEPLLKKARGEK